MKQYAIIDVNKPIVKVTFTGEKSTDENFESYLSTLETIYEERKILTIIFDAQKASIPNISHQKMQAKWISEHWELIQTYCKGTAYVIPNMAIRAVLKMIFSFQKQPTPYKIFSNNEEAESWVKDLLSEEKHNSN